MPELFSSETAPDVALEVGADASSMH